MAGLPVAYLRWQGELHTQPRDEMRQLLAIRMAWELVLWRYFQKTYPTHFRQLDGLWSAAKQQLPEMFNDHERLQRPLWVWAKAGVELSTALECAIGVSTRAGAAQTQAAGRLLYRCTFRSDSACPGSTKF